MDVFSTVMVTGSALNSIGSALNRMMLGSEDTFAEEVYNGTINPPFYAAAFRRPAHRFYAANRQATSCPGVPDTTWHHEI